MESPAGGLGKPNDSVPDLSLGEPSKSALCGKGFRMLVLAFEPDGEGLADRGIPIGIARASAEPMVLGDTAP